MKPIYAGNNRYLSQLPELKNGLPFGIFSKRATDVGGTFVTLQSDNNYIIVCPTRDLVDSITSDENSPYKVFSVYDKVLQKHFKEYVLTNKIHKIAVTYDSLPKVIDWLIKFNYDFTEYNVLVDEYHLLLDDMGFRQKAINKLVNILKRFKHYTLMSATPIPENFLPNNLKELPFTEVIWENQRVLMPTRIKTGNVYKTTVALINEFQSGLFLEHNGVNTKVEELYIFLNSVNGIMEVLSTCKLSNDDVKIVCSDTIRNNTVLGNYKVSTTISPNKKINFFTKKGFQGCNLFSNNALVVVVSDGKKAHTLIDVETTMYQIVGRLRTNDKYDNIFKDRIWHIFSTRRNVQTESDFQLQLADTKLETEIVMSTYNKLSKLERQVYSKRMKIDDLICFYDEEADSYIYSELKEEYLKHNFNLCNHIYTNGLTLRDSYINAKLEISNEIYANCDEVILKKIITVSFKELLQNYIELRKSNSNDEIIKRYELEHPIFKEAYELLGTKGISTCNFVESAIQELIYAKSDKTMMLLYKEFYNIVGENNFIDSKTAKEIIKSIYTKHKVISGKSTVTVLNGCKWFEVVETSKKINGKTTHGIRVNKIEREYNF